MVRWINTNSKKSAIERMQKEANKCICQTFNSLEHVKSSPDEPFFKQGLILSE